MTDEQIMSKIAQLDNVSYNPIAESEPTRLEDLPQYLTSRDAIMKVVEKQSMTHRLHFIIKLWESMCIKHEEPWSNDDMVEIFCASPRQICIALLKAKKLWED